MRAAMNCFVQQEQAERETQIAFVRNFQAQGVKKLVTELPRISLFVKSKTARHVDHCLVYCRGAEGSFTRPIQLSKCLRKARYIVCWEQGSQPIEVCGQRLNPDLQSIKFRSGNVACSLTGPPVGIVQHRLWVGELLQRMRTTLADIREKLMRRRHEALDTVGSWLHRVVQGYFNYYAVPGNLKRLEGFRSEVCRAWRHALLRRSQRHRMSWERFNRLARRYVPYSRQVHPHPAQRFAASRP